MRSRVTDCSLLVASSQDLARSNPRRNASEPPPGFPSTPQIQGCDGRKAWCRIPGFISAEISGVFTLRARERHVEMPGRMVYGLRGFPPPTTKLAGDKSTYATDATSSEFKA